MPPAARLTDMHTCPMVTGVVPHVGGPIIAPCCPTVLIGSLPAARVTDMLICTGPPDMIVKGSAGVFIGGLPAARIGDITAHGGVIVVGLPTVIIGEVGSGPGGGAAGAAAAPSAGAGAAANPGAVFATQDEAAKAALNAANPQSIAANQEFGGVIYRDANGKYGYTGPVGGTDQGFDPSQAPAPPGTTRVGDYHTHGDYSTVDPATGRAVRTNDPSQDQFNSDNFSPTDKRGIAADSHGDPNYRGYLGTPSGKFKSYDPSTGTVSEL